MKSRFGSCCICGVYGKLSFEHVPPRAAFNHQPILLSTFEDIQQVEHASGNLDNIRGKKQQRGMGAHTLCGKCNSDTGAWYGSSYVAWVRQGMELAEYSAQAPSLSYTFRIHPLNVLKQIICMFMSTNGSQFAQKHPDLVKFVLGKRAQFINPKTRIFAYHSLSPRVRQTGVSVAGDFHGGTFCTMSEFVFAPFGYLMTFDSPPPDSRLTDITGFNQFHIDDWHEINLKLAVLPIYTYLPGDYRDKATVLRQIEASKLQADR